MISSRQRYAETCNICDTRTHVVLAPVVGKLEELLPLSALLRHLLPHSLGFLKFMQSLPRERKSFPYYESPFYLFLQLRVLVNGSLDILIRVRSQLHLETNLFLNEANRFLTIRLKTYIHTNPSHFAFSLARKHDRKSPFFL